MTDTVKIDGTECRVAANDGFFTVWLPTKDSAGADRTASVHFTRAGINIQEDFGGSSRVTEITKARDGGYRVDSDVARFEQHDAHVFNIVERALKAIGEWKPEKRLSPAQAEILRAYERDFLNLERTKA